MPRRKIDMRRGESKITLKALVESEKHWEDVVERFDPEEIVNQLKWFEANCMADSCAMCNLDFLCDECLLYDKGGACFEKWREALKAAGKGGLRKHHLEAVLKHIKRTCDLYRDKVWV